jgi:hypothetical protein
VLEMIPPRGSDRADRARSLTASPPTGLTATASAASACGAGASGGSGPLEPIDRPFDGMTFLVPLFVEGRGRPPREAAAW